MNELFLTQVLFLTQHLGYFKDKTIGFLSFPISFPPPSQRFLSSGGYGKHTINLAWP